MPCTMMQDYDSGQATEERCRKLEAQNTELTQMLCALIRALGTPDAMPPEVKAWAEKHHAWDLSQGRG